MNEVSELITENPFFNITGWIVGAIALGVAIISFKRKQISYQFYTNVLVANKLSNVNGLAITFNNNPVEQLSITSLDIQNTGNVIIEYEKDVYVDHKLKIIPTDTTCEILSAIVVSESSDTIKCKLIPDESAAVVVCFDVLEKNDRVSINIYHTGNSNTGFDIGGRIKGGKKISHNFRNILENIMGIRFKGIGYISVSAGLFCLLFLFIENPPKNIRIFLYYCLSSLFLGWFFCPL